MFHYSLINGIVEHLKSPSILAISEYGTSSTINPLFLRTSFNLVNPFSEIITSSETEKKQPAKENQSENKGGLLSGILGKKK